MTRTIRATVPADLVDKIGKAEGLVRGERESRLSFQRRCLALYDVRLEVHVAPLRYGTAKRANNAGTKVIVTYDDGRGGTTQGTGWAGEYSTNAQEALGLLGSALPGWQYAIDATAPESGIDVHLFGPDGELSTATHSTLPMAICSAIAQAKIDGVKA